MAIGGMLAVLLATAPPGLGQQANPPVLLVYSAPDVPEEKLLAGEAEAECDILVDERGLVTAAECRAAEASEWLVQPSRLAAQKLRFIPARQGDRLFAAWVRWKFRSSASRPLEAVSAPAAAGSGVISGEVLIAGEREAVQGADLIAQGLGLATTTDAKGRYSLRLPAGEHAILATAPGFKPRLLKIVVAPAMDVDGSTMLFRSALANLEAVVRGERAGAADAPARNTLSSEELRNLPGSKNDVIRVIENLPGLARAPFGGGQLIVRGSRPTDTGAYVEGLRLPVLYHLLNGPSVLGEEMVSRIDFMAGGAGVFYGGQLAGIVNVTPRTGDFDRFHGALAADLEKASASLRGNLGEKTEFAVSGRRGYVNPVASFFADSSKPYQLPVYSDYQGNLSRSFDGGRLSLLVLGSADSLATVGQGRGNTGTSTADHDVSFHRVRLALELRPSSQTTITIAPSFGVDSQADSTEGTSATVDGLPQRSSSDSLAFGLRAQLTHRPSEAIGLRFGFDGSADRVRYDASRYVDRELLSPGHTVGLPLTASGVQHFTDAGVYAEVEWSAGALKIVPGLRADGLGWQGRSFLTVDPRLWARWQLSKEMLVYAYAGVHHQRPQASELDAILGNPRLLPERADQYGLGWEGTDNEWSLRVEGFLQRRASLVEPVPVQANGDGTFSNPLLGNTGQGRAFGVEVLLRRQLSGRVYGWISYTLSRSRELALPGAGWLPTAFDQTHVLTALAAFRLTPQLEVSARFRFATGNPIRDTRGSFYDSDAGAFVPIQGPVGSARLPSFQQLDVQINNLWIADSWRLALYAEFRNLQDRSNPEALAYDYRYGKQDFVVASPFTGSVGAKVSF